MRLYDYIMTFEVGYSFLILAVRPTPWGCGPSDEEDKA